MKNQKLISRNVIRKFLIGGYMQPTNVSYALLTGKPQSYIATYPFKKLFTWVATDGEPGKTTIITPEDKILDDFLKDIRTRVRNSSNHYLMNTNSSINLLSTSLNSRNSLGSISINPSTNTRTSRRSPGKDVKLMSDLELTDLIEGEYPKIIKNFAAAELKVRHKLSRISSLSKVQTPQEEVKKYLVGQGVDNKGFTIELTKAVLLDNNIDIKDKSDEEIVKLFEKYLEEQNAKRNIEPPKYVAPTLQLTPSTSPFAVTTPSSVDLNRADVRAIMNHYGLDTTPSLRKAFRKYLAGDRNQDISFIDLNSNLHRDWVAPFVVFKKKGGGLISRNSIERFLKGKAIKKVQEVIYDALATPIHAVFGNPGKRKGYSGGRFGGAGVSGRWKNPTYSYNEIYPADTLLVPATQTFNDAFADARRRGLDTFEFNGGIYGTELGDNPNWKAAGDARTRDAVIPVPIPADTIRRTSDVPRNDTIITDDAYRRYPISTSNINKIFNK